MLGPTAIAMYCLLSNMYVMGDAFHVWFVGKSQSTFPFDASAAMNDPLFSPKNTRPDAVEITPAEAVAGVVTWGRSHAISPVCMFRARRDFVYVSPGAGLAAPPMYPLPAAHSIVRFENRLQRSRAEK